MKRWYVLMRRDPGPKFKPSKHTKICSRHFKKDDFLVGKSGRRLLKVSANPSIFVWTRGSVPRREIFRHQPTPPSLKTEPMQTQTTLHVESDNSKLIKEIESLKSALKLQQQAAELFQKERDHLKEMLHQSMQKKGPFSIHQVMNNPKLVSFYTGFPSYFEMSKCLEILDPGSRGENIIYIDSKAKSQDKRKPSSRPRKLTIEDEFFLVLCRLRLGLFIEDLAQRFAISHSGVTRICLSWINFMYLRLGNIPIWPTQETIRRTMPESMKAKYPNLEWILDAFEIQCQRPSSLMMQSQSYSNYKSRNTFKGLIAIIPSGQIGFISDLYQGSVSDRELVIRSGFLKQHHNRGAMWLVDKGFQIADLAEPLGVTVNMPAFVGARSQMTADEVFHTQQIASERIHVERAINKVKNFHIFDSPQQLSMYGSVNQIWAVCSMLTLWQNPIISA